MTEEASPILTGWRWSSLRIGLIINHQQDQVTSRKSKVAGGDMAPAGPIPKPPWVPKIFIHRVKIDGLKSDLKP
jgi:hypothetical protein